jgi:glycosyltransferase involved in cell wall biosynthesis
MRAKKARCLVPKQSSRLTKVKTPRTAIVIGSLSLGGAERQAIMLGDYLQNTLGWDVLALGMTPPGMASELCDQRGIRWSYIPANWQVSPVSSLARYFKALSRFSPEAIISYTATPNLICGLLWRLCGAKTTIWSQRDNGFERFPSWAETLAVKNTPRFIANSKHGAEFLKSSLAAHRDKVSVIYNGITPLQRVDRKAARSALGVSMGSLVACMVANLHESKDHLTLVKAWKRVINTTPDATLLLAGRLDTKATEIKDAIQQLGLQHAIHLLGPISDVATLLSASDLMIHSTWREGVPNSVIEAMSLGIPTIGTDIPGMREAVGDTAPLFPAGDADGAAALVEQLRNQGCLHNMGHEQEIRARSLFGLERMCSETADIIREACE